jgi:hypothetical protein
MSSDDSVLYSTGSEIGGFASDSAIKGVPSIAILSTLKGIACLNPVHWLFQPKFDMPRNASRRHLAKQGMGGGVRQV